MQICEEEEFTEGAKLLQDAAVASCRPNASTERLREDPKVMQQMLQQLEQDLIGRATATNRVTELSAPGQVTNEVAMYCVCVSVCVCIIFVMMHSILHVCHGVCIHACMYTYVSIFCSLWLCF